MDDYAASGVIKAVQLSIVARKTDAGEAAMKGFYRSGGTNYETDEFTLTDTYGIHQKIWEDNPADSNAWEESDIDQGEFGVRAMFTTTTTV
jgi:hypothetical protein